MAKVKIIMARQEGENPFLFHYKNEAGASLITSVGSGLGGKSEGLTPLELVLAGLIGCSCVDLVLIASKKRKDIQHIEVELEAEKEPLGQLSVFTAIHLTFKLALHSDMTRDEAGAIIKDSIDKYCSVAHVIKSTSKITWEIQIL